MLSHKFMYQLVDGHTCNLSLLQCMQQYIAFEVMEGAYDISCPDPDCPTQGVLSQHQMERLTDKELLDKHRTFRLMHGVLVEKNDQRLVCRLNTEVSMDAARTWCPSAGCDTICHICAGTKSQVTLEFDAIGRDGHWIHQV